MDIQDWLFKNFWTIPVNNNLGVLSKKVEDALCEFGSLRESIVNLTLALSRIDKI